MASYAVAYGIMERVDWPERSGYAAGGLSLPDSRNYTKAMPEKALCVEKFSLVSHVTCNYTLRNKGSSGVTHITNPLP
jgi:hypothetical protein